MVPAGGAALATSSLDPAARAAEPHGEARQEALDYRRSSDLMRLLAATQSAPAPVQLPAQEPGKGVDPLATLATLAELRDKGLITPDEFEAKKVEILSRVWKGQRATGGRRLAQQATRAWRHIGRRPVLARPLRPRWASRGVAGSRCDPSPSEPGTSSERAPHSSWIFCRARHQTTRRRPTSTDGGSPTGTRRRCGGSNGRARTARAATAERWARLVQGLRPTDRQGAGDQGGRSDLGEDARPAPARCGRL